MEEGCPKCGNTEFDEKEVRMTGSGLSRFFDVQTERFDAASCRECGYTEFYSKQRSKKGDVLDFFLGG